MFFLPGGLNSNQNYYRVKLLFQRQVYLLTQTFIHEGKNLRNRLRGPGVNISPRPMIHAFVSLCSQRGASVISRAGHSRSYCGLQINRIKCTGCSLVKRTAWAPSASFKSIVLSLGPRRSCFLICITSCASAALGHLYATPSANWPDIALGDAQKQLLDSFFFLFTLVIHFMPIGFLLMCICVLFFPFLAHLPPFFLSRSSGNNLSHRNLFGSSIYQLPPRCLFTFVFQRFFGNICFFFFF